MRKLLGIIFLLFFTKSGFACDCNTYSILEKHYKSIKYIYTGEVIELIEKKYDDIFIPEIIKGEDNIKLYIKIYYPKRYFAKVRVLRSFKKAKESDILILESDFSNCQPNYKLNQKYLFFANKIGKGKMIMDNCSPWDSLENCSEKINMLEQLSEK